MKRIRGQDGTVTYRCNCGYEVAHRDVMEEHEAWRHLHGARKEITLPGDTTPTVFFFFKAQTTYNLFHEKLQRLFRLDLDANHTSSSWRRLDWTGPGWYYQGAISLNMRRYGRVVSVMLPATTILADRRESAHEMERLARRRRATAAVVEEVLIASGLIPAPATAAQAPVAPVAPATMAPAATMPETDEAEAAHG